MKFGTRIREAQGRFRDTSRTISSAAKQPQDPKGKRNSHLLRTGYEIENLFPGIRNEEEVLRFFGDRRIKWWKGHGRGGDSKGPGPTRNMASSQVFCVNFWYPIKEDVALLTALLRSINPSIEGVAEISSRCVKDGARLTSFVEFEWVGMSSTLEKKRYSRGSNATSVDAFLIGTHGDKKIGFFFEWKLVEQYREDYLGDGQAGLTRRSTYQRYLEAPECVVSRDIPLKAFLYEPLYQIFRMGLLGQKMICEDREGDHGLDQAYVIPVYPRDNLAYSMGITSPVLRDMYGSGGTVSEIASRFFSQPVIFKSIHADELWGVVKAHTRSPRYSEWVKYMDERYFKNGV